MVLRSATGVITLIIHMLAHPTVITVLTGSPAASLSALARGMAGAGEMVGTVAAGMAGAGIMTTGVIVADTVDIVAATAMARTDIGADTDTADTVIAAAPHRVHSVAAVITATPVVDTWVADSTVAAVASTAVVVAASMVAVVDSTVVGVAAFTVAVDTAKA